MCHYLMANDLIYDRMNTLCNNTLRLPKCVMKTEKFVLTLPDIIWPFDPLPLSTCKNYAFFCFDTLVDFLISAFLRNFFLCQDR